MSDLTNVELLDAFRASEWGSDESVELFERLRARLAEPDSWPEQTFAAAKEVFGPAVYNLSSRTYLALNRRIAHAMRTWRLKYGPLNPEQEKYADSVLASCLRSARTEAAGEVKKLWPYAQAGIGRVISHERVHEGFERRAAKVDVTDLIAGAVT